jgi:formate hydrogenlyase subunit 3/multisubunit Na+/H+ antiporter MnhD subunit
MLLGGLLLFLGGLLLIVTTIGYLLPEPLPKFRPSTPVRWESGFLAGLVYFSIGGALFRFGQWLGRQ